MNSLPEEEPFAFTPNVSGYAVYQYVDRLSQCRQSSINLALTDCLSTMLEVTEVPLIPRSTEIFQMCFDYLYRLTHTATAYTVADSLGVPARATESHQSNARLDCAVHGFNPIDITVTSSLNDRYIVATHQLELKDISGFSSGAGGGVVVETNQSGVDGISYYPGNPPLYICYQLKLSEQATTPESQSHLAESIQKYLKWIDHSKASVQPEHCIYVYVIAHRTLSKSQYHQLFSAIDDSKLSKLKFIIITEDWIRERYGPVWCRRFDFIERSHSKLSVVATPSCTAGSTLTSSTPK